MMNKKNIFCRFFCPVVLAVSVMAVFFAVPALGEDLAVRPEADSTYSYHIKSLTSMDISVTVRTDENLGKLPPEIAKLEDNTENTFKQQFYSLVEAKYSSKAINVFDRDSEFESMYNMFSIYTKMIQGKNVTKGKVVADEKTSWLQSPRSFAKVVDERGDKRIFSFVGLEHSYMVTSKGETKDYSIPIKLAQFFSWNSTWPSVAPNFPITFPKEPKKAGETWIMELKIPFIKTAPQKPAETAKIECKYVKKENYKGIPAYKITISGGFTAGDKDKPIELSNPDGRSMLGLVNEKIEGTFYFDEKTGMLLSGTAITKQTTNIFISGNIREITTTRQVAVGLEKFANKDNAMFQFDMPPDEEAPKAEEPGTDEEPKAEEPKAEEPGTDEEPKAEEPKAEEPGTDEEPKAEEPKAEEPGTDEEPGAEEPKAEEPGTDEEPKPEEPKEEEPADENQ